VTRRNEWSALPLLALLCAALPAMPASAGFGAIAWDATTGKSGWVWNQPTQQKAVVGAIRECGASGCKLVVRPTTICAALATTADGKAAGAAARKTRDEASVAARANCEKRNAGECTLRVSDCNK
jgi:hypothetical protein